MKKGGTPLERLLEKVTYQAKGKDKDQYLANCPTHEDKKASLSIHETEPGGIVEIHCHAGCYGGNILQALGLPVSEEYIYKDKNIRGPQKRVIDQYDYVDEKGNLLYQVVRYEPKGFSQRRPDGKGGWIWTIKDIEMVPYRLPELISGVKEGKLIFIVEGEKDAKNLSKLSLTATTNSGGAGKWEAGFSKWFSGADVVILPDNDIPGREHAERIKELLNGTAKSVRIVDLPGLPQKGDVSDWIEAGGTTQSLLDLVEKAEESTSQILNLESSLPELSEGELPKNSLPELLKSDLLRCSDLGNAKRFARKYQDKVKYCNEWDQWLIYDGIRWAVDKKLQVEDMAKTIPLDIYQEVTMASTAEDRIRLSKHAQRSESATSIRNMLKLAMSDPTIAITHEAFDANPMLINVLNGVIDLSAGNLDHHSPDFLITKLAPVEYNPHATSDTWEDFLRDVTGGDQELERFLCKAVGYSLTGSTSEEVLFFVYGPTATGKSTLLEAIRSVLGDYAKTADFESFLKRNGSNGPRDDIAMLEGARFAVSVEVDEGKKLAEGLIKQLTGGDSLACRRLYQNTFEFLPSAKLWLAANHKPKVSAEDGAMWRRIRTIPFDQTVPEEKRDHTLKSRLRNTKVTGPAILAWAVKGCQLWQQEGLKAPKRVLEATEGYRISQDIIGEFINDMVVPYAGAKLSRSGLYREYQAWCTSNGERQISQTELTQKLKDRGWEDGPRGKERCFKNFSLRSTQEVSNSPDPTKPFEEVNLSTILGDIDASDSINSLLK